jgi:hypothetical protein
MSTVPRIILIMLKFVNLGANAIPGKAIFLIFRIRSFSTDYRIKSSSKNRRM